MNHGTRLGSGNCDHSLASAQGIIALSMSNFVFSRRALQQSINRLAALLQRDQLSSIVDRLNRPGNSRLPAMWELVMLDALSREGVLRHEIPLPNGRCPDFELTVSLAASEKIYVIGDVATVSDAGLDEQNPVDVLRTELYRLAAKAGLNPNHFGYDVRGARVGPYGDARMKLFLPSKGSLLMLMGKEVAPWISRLKAEPQQSESFEYATPEISFSLTYDPKQRYARGGHLSYDVAASRDKNPLFKALKGKIDQLNGAPPTALRLVIACDGGSALLRQSPLMRSPGTFCSREVAEDFLRKNSSVDAILLAAVEEQRQILNPTTTYRMKYDLVVAPMQARSPRMTPVVIAALETVFSKAVQHIPQPVQSAHNAAARCRLPGCGPDMIGGYKMTDRNISLSSRALQRLLAGEITNHEFIAAHGWNDAPGPSNPFARAVRSGQMITKIEIEGAGDKDDDWLTFSFGMADPAAAPFCVPAHPACE